MRPPCGDHELEGAAWQTLGPLQSVQPHANPPAERSSDRRLLWQPPREVVRFKLILESEPNHVQSHGNLGVAYAGLGDRVAAVRHLDKAIELDPEYEPANDNRCIILALPPGERLNCGQIREVDFYVDRERARRPHARQQYRFANRGDDMNSMPQASPASGLKST